jgi:hypothetical protein
MNPLPPAASRRSPPLTLRVPGKHSGIGAALSAVVAVVVQLLLPGPVTGQWVQAPGTGWVAAAVHYQDTRERYDILGETRPFFANGHAVTTSLYLTSALGILPGVDVWAQVPFHRLQFDDITGERNSTGIGDPKAWVRVAPMRLVGSDFPLAVRAGVKLPVGDFPIDAEVVPLGEGQRDWEVILEVGHSFYPASVYAMAWIGYRWREKDEKTDRDWGDERFFFAQVGGSFGKLGYKVIAEGWDGRTPVLEGIPTRNSRRDFAQVMPTLTYPLGPGQLEAGARVPIRGRNLPAGEALILGYFFDWSL